ncbi:TfoX/Sxy family protein [Sedimentitalea sp. JM2-8]|uniref:TfoX/Sxy family protein n=1 Tax=Sedimentitalea xiamensis TaxID=3050037 RepID=A0ABT7FCH7_9RHOB|nr:TfoX/Sxy family protein [Sedimentitalea xiamensis]MDK3072812.1 TfoX/Sxy family protein [Sedimentitalea xiamensis]
MTYSEPMAETMRADLGVEPGLSEQKMFGGLCFLLHGNMIGGIGKDGALYRPGKPNEDAALALEGVTPMVMGGRRMGGFVRLDDDGFADDVIRRKLTEISLGFVAGLPPKDMIQG